MPGLMNFLEWCKELEIRNIVVSSSRHGQLESALGATGIREFFEIVVGHEETAGKKKPDPYPWQYALELAKLSPGQAIAVEDTDKGITSASAAGLRCIGIRNDQNTQHELAQAEYIIEDYSALKSYLLR
jgi:HAD superfamily hydrolase (TIGR01509 family)